MTESDRANCPMRTALAAVIVALFIAVVSAEQADSRPKPVNLPMLTQPKLIIRSEDLFPLTRPTKLGMFTLVQSQTNGEVIRLSIPVGNSQCGRLMRSQIPAAVVRNGRLISGSVHKFYIAGKKK